MSDSGGMERVPAVPSPIPRRQRVWRLVTVTVTSAVAITISVLIGHDLNPLWFPDPPTIVGHNALSAGDDIGAEGVSTTVPQGWHGDADLIDIRIEGDGHEIVVEWFDMVDGAIGDGKKEHAAAAERDAQLYRPVTGPLVHRKVAGLPAVEVASTNDPTNWHSLSTYVFAQDRVIRVRCEAASIELEAVLPGCATVLDDLEVADG